MRQHGLIAAGWVFAWGHGKRRLGAAEVRRPRRLCRQRPTVIRTIRLSRHLVTLNDEPVVRDIILHEIAHALAGLEHGHNATWRQVCRDIGATPRRLAGDEVRLAPARYELWCDMCRQVIGDRHRRVSPSRLAAAYCRACGPAATGRLRLRESSPR